MNFHKNSSRVFLTVALYYFILNDGKPKTPMKIRFVLNYHPSPSRVMSKFKVSLIHFMRQCLTPSKTKHRYLYILAFIKNLRDYLPLVEPQSDEKAFKYWVRHTTHETIAMADKLFEDERYVEVYELLNRIRFSDEVEVLWRVARALYNISFDRGVTREERWQMIEEAHEMLEMAMKAGEKSREESANVHKWMAIILDTKFGLVNLQTRVKNSTVVKEHLMKAVELNPLDFTVQYMLGKWCFEMSSLSWFQRMLAKYFIAWEPPHSSYHEAFRYLSMAEQLQPRTFLPNIYLLGRTCVEIGQFYRAKYYLNVAVNLPPKDECEKCCVLQARHLIKKLERYDLGKSVLFYDSFPFGFSD